MQKLAFILAAFIISIMARAEDGTHDRSLAQSKQTLGGPNSIGPINSINSINKKRISKLDFNLEKANQDLRIEEN
ncbi:hypothetical protein [Sediminicola luteus]|uniref:Uncharacterized protein n=1 Tax=Sediminicola luteus TaxID=319238 RepID=A0ABV2TU49_9FLAO